VAVIVYDVTAIDTFYTLERWVEDVRKERGKEAVVFIVGNKSDQPSVINAEQLEQAV
jgi:Ras-related protein Rab-6A